MEPLAREECGRWWPGAFGQAPEKEHGRGRFGKAAGGRFGRRSIRQDCSDRGGFTCQDSGSKLLRAHSAVRPSRSCVARSLATAVDFSCGHPLHRGSCMVRDTLLPSSPRTSTGNLHGRRTWRSGHLRGRSRALRRPRHWVHARGRLRAARARSRA